MTAMPTRADDTDIYTVGETSGGDPLVMLSIDVRPSTGAQFQCTGACLTYFLDQEATACEFASNSGEFHDGETCAGTLTGIADLFEYLRLSLKVALKAFEGRNINIGLMLNHKNENNCVGPTATNCSNGGMITMGFTELLSGGYARKRINNQLRGVRAAALQDASGSNHSYQGAELFFEFFRYLTGQAIYNGHNGTSDWGGPLNAPGNNDGSGNVRKVLGVPSGIAEKGNHCGPDTAPGTYTAENDMTTIYGAHPNRYRNDGACWDNSTSTTAHADAVAPAENAAHTTYVSPLVTACPKIYTINWINGQVNQDSDSNAAIQAATSAGGMGITMPSSNGMVNVVGALHSNYDFSNTTQGAKYSIPPGGTATQVTSYFVATSQAGPEVPNIATAGGTTAINIQTANIQSNPAYLKDIFSDIFNQILSVSTTFVAAAIPANVFNRAESLDDVYIAIFQPDQDNKRFWNGNVKKLRIVGASGGNQLEGVTAGSNAINPSDGRISSTATTFWTDTTRLNATQYNQVTATPVTGWREGDALATTDGRQVNRGAAGQQIPGYRTNASNDNSTSSTPGTDNTTGLRDVYYDPASFNPTTTTALPDLNVDATTRAALCTPSGALGLTGVNDAFCDPLLKFMRGICPAGIASCGNTGIANIAELTTDTPRKWMMGDPLHSRPAPINYGALTGFSADNPAIYLAVSGNDGALHFIQNTNTGSAECLLASCNSGREVWAFYPRLAMGIQKTLYQNTVGTHPYGFDGSPIVYTKDVNGNGNVESGDKVWLYNGMRRGGRAIYALDITSPTSPQFKWRIDNSSTGFAELGYTFSNPKVGMVDVAGVATPALFFAGGYDPNKDRQNTNGIGDNDSMGNALYVVNADTGALLWKATYGASIGPQSGDIYTHSGMLDSLPSEVAIADTNADGLTDRLVVGDTGGKVWRADFNGSDRSKWSLVMLANLGRHVTATKAEDRRFFHQAKIVQTQDASGVKYDAVLIGSGDREDPLDINAAGATNNYFYGIRDYNVSPLSVGPSPGNTPPSVTATTQANLADVTECPLATSCTLTLTYGWKLALDHGGSATEKSLAPALAINNVIYFTTYLPPGSAGLEDDDAEEVEPASCGPAEGSGLLYIVNLQDATAAYDETNTSSANSPDEKADRTIDLESGGIPAQPVYIPPGDTRPDCVLLPDLTCKSPKTSVRKRSFWQRIEDVPS